MPRIKAFCPVRPDEAYAGQFLMEGSVIMESGSHNARQSSSYPNTLELGPAVARYAISDSGSSFEDLLNQGILIKEKQPGIYIYEFENDEISQVGVWVLTSIEDYKNGQIKKHELTRLADVINLKASRQQTGLEGNPVLIAYRTDKTLDRLIKNATDKVPTMIFHNNGNHRFWKVEDVEVQQHFVNAFGQIKTCYLADGHHRTAAALMMAEEQGLLLSGNDSPACFFESLYMATDQLRIYEYYRFIRPDQQVNEIQVLKQIKPDFEIILSDNNMPVQPKTEHHFGMYLAGQWYHLHARNHAANNSEVIRSLDVTILQERLLAPVLNIVDVNTDTRLSFIGGPTAMDKLLKSLSEYPDAVAFTLAPITINQLIEVANAGEFMPPKSTWIDPKIPFGLLMHKLL